MVHPEDRIARLLPLLRANGRCPTSFLGLGPDMEAKFTREGTGFVAYRRGRRADVILGDPVCPTREAATLLRSFADRSRPRTVAAVAVTEMGAASYREAGYQGLVAGAEAVVNLGSFSLTNPRQNNVRRSARHAEQAGVAVEEIDTNLLTTNGFAEEFQRITSEWLRTRRTGLFSFIVGSPFMTGWDLCWHFVARSSRGIEGFAIIYPIFPTRAAYLDITRRRPDAPNGTMDLLLSTAFRQLRQEEVSKVYLGMIPCAPTEGDDRGARGLLMRLAFSRMDALYPMQTEYFFKRKFATQWEPRYAFFSPRLSLSGLHAIYRSLWPGGTSEILRHKFSERAARKSRRRRAR